MLTLKRASLPALTVDLRDRGPVFKPPYGRRRRWTRRDRASRDARESRHRDAPKASRAGGRLRRREMTSNNQHVMNQLETPQCLDIYSLYC